MRQRVEVKINGEVVIQIICKHGMTDGELAIMLEEAAVDLRYNVMKDAETLYTRAEG